MIYPGQTGTFGTVDPSRSSACEGFQKVMSPESMKNAEESLAFLQYHCWDNKPTGNWYFSVNNWYFLLREPEEILQLAWIPFCDPYGILLWVIAFRLSTRRLLRGFVSSGKMLFHQWILSCKSSSCDVTSAFGPNTMYCLLDSSNSGHSTGSVWGPSFGFLGRTSSSHFDPL